MLRVLIVGACVLLPALSFGANAPATKEIIIDADGVIEGRTTLPLIGDVDHLQDAKFGSIIRVRKNFNDKVVRSVSEL